MLVTGGTGPLGRLVVSRLQNAGHEARVLSRHGPVGVKGIDPLRFHLMRATSHATRRPQ